MAEDQYEYRGLIADAWDLLRGDTSAWPDRFFYRDRIGESGQPVLDVGCGTGRLLLDYLADGIDIDGVDNSPEMLALCREKAALQQLAPTLYEQPMEALDIPRRYRTIIVPSSSFQLICSKGAASETMRRFHDHLQPGGTLVMPFMMPQAGAPPEAGRPPQWRKAAERERPDGAVVRRWTRERYDFSQQVGHTEDRYEVVMNGEVVQTEYHHRSPAGRWYSQEQSLDLYEGAGFLGMRVYRDFTTEPAAAGDRIWTVVGQRMA